MAEINQISLDDVVTPDDIVKEYPNKFTKPQLTWLLRNRHRNGLHKAGAVSMVSRKFYINKPAFARWLLSQQA